MNSWGSRLFPGSAATLWQEGHFLTPPHPALVLPPQWSLCCPKQDKSETGLGPSSAACLPQVLFYIFIVWGQKRLLAVLQMGILPGIFFFFFFILIFLSLEDKEAAPEALEFSFQHYMEGEKTHPNRGCCSERETAGTSDRVPGTIANP